VNRRWIVTGVFAVAATGVAAFLLIDKADRLTEAWRELPAELLLGALAIHFVMLIARAEAWRVALQAAGDGAPPPRMLTHLSNAGGFVVGTVETHAALPTRMAILRRLAPEKAPSLRAMVLSDAPVFTVEICLAALLVIVAASAIPGLPWWAGPAGVILSGGIVLVLRMTHQRLAHHQLASGLAVLGHSRLRVRLVLWVTAVVGLTIARVWILAAACGLPAGPEDAALLYLAVSTLGLLPIGPASSPAATIAVAGSSAGVGAAGAAGLAISASSIGAVLAYTATTGVIVLWTRVMSNGRHDADEAGRGNGDTVVPARDSLGADAVDHDEQRDGRGKRDEREDSAASVGEAEARRRGELLPDAGDGRR
jgi:hypothetical protein